MKRISLVVVFCLITLVAVAQPVQKFGKIDSESLDISYFQSWDSTASAVVLFSTGKVEYNNRLEIEYTVHNRIKILNENGYDNGTIVLVMPEGNSIMKIKDLEGITWIEEKPGKFKKYKLNKKDIFTQNASENIEHVKFTMPNLEPGAIIEYTYTVEIKYYHYFPDWKFQWNIPVLYSEFYSEIPQYFVYNLDLKGNVPLTSTDYNSETVLKSVMFEGRFSNVQYDLNSAKYVMENIPAFKTEPYVASQEDNRSQMDFYLSAVKWPNRQPILIYETWAKTGTDILDYKPFKEMIDVESEHKKIAAEVITTDSTVEQKAKTLFDFVVQNYEWNNSLRLSPDKKFKEFLKDKAGNGSSLNLFLINLCKAAGLKVYPVAISTRQNGAIKFEIASASQFNHVIVAVEIAPKQYLFMDATNKNRAYNLLAVNDLSKDGLMLSKDSGWVQIENANVRTSETLLLDIEIQKDGLAKGMASYTTTGYRSVSIRNSFEEVNDSTSSTDIVKKLWFSEMKDVNIDSVSVQNIEHAYQEPIIHVYFNVSNYAIVTDSVVYLNPLLIGRFKTNPLKLNSRINPVDFGYAFNDKVIAKVTIPEGFSVDELPKPKQFLLPGKTAVFRFMGQEQPNGFMVLSDLKILKPVYQVAEYQAIREFFQQIVESQNVMITLKKK